MPRTSLAGNARAGRCSRYRVPLDALRVCRWRLSQPLLYRGSDSQASDGLGSGRGYPELGSIDLVNGHGGGRLVWLRHAKRDIAGGAKGTIEDCLAIPGLWLDVDVAGPGHRLSGLATSYDQARLFIEAYPEPMTAIVRSGHGFQAWWRFPEMIEARDALPALASWRLTWLNRGIAAGIHIDDVWDMPRILRLPGTRNFKGT